MSNEKSNEAPRVTISQIEASINSEHYFTADDGALGRVVDPMIRKGMAVTLADVPDAFKPLTLITICVLILNNGHRIVGVNEGPVSAANHDAALGRTMAREKAIEQIWPLMGFELRERLFQRQQTIARVRGEA